MSDVTSPTESMTCLPDWATEELRELAEIEPQLYPTASFVAKFHSWSIPDDREAGDLYATCFEQLLGFVPDLIFLVPWLVPGGADQGTLRHVEAGLAEGKRVLVISTENVESPWAARIPHAARFIELGRLGGHLSVDQRLIVLTRLVLQLEAPVIHVIQSQLGWELVRRHGKSLVAVEKRLYVSVFCDSFDECGVRWSYPSSYLIDCWPFLTAVLCDSEWYKASLIAQFGCAQEKISTVYFPAAAESTPVYSSTPEPRVLWAGRFAKQKRVDLLIEIARLLPEVSFDIYGYAVDDEERAMKEKMRELPNVTVYGVFDSLKSVVERKAYSLLLYTSAWDGLPITLLDTTIAGLPIVASSVGGVSEFISEKTGYPVENIDAPPAYAKRICEAIVDDLTRRRKWESAAELVESRHTMEHFFMQLKILPGYLDHN